MRLLSKIAVGALLLICGATILANEPPSEIMIQGERYSTSLTELELSDKELSNAD